MFRRYPLLVGVAVAAVIAGPALAQTKYAPWQDPNAAKQSVQKSQALIDELNKLIDDAEKSRAADPRFLSDLRDLARRHERPWRVTLVSDDFSDGNFTQNPVWKVTAGKFWIEKGYGLRGTATETQPTSDGQKKVRGEDVATQLLGSILNQALGGRQEGQQQTAAPPASPRAAISLPRRISNAFALRLEMNSWKEEGRLEIGPYQGAQPVAGYRLVYRSGGTPSLQLVRVSSRGTTVLVSDPKSVKLEDRRNHVVEWTRDRAGVMVVRIDGSERIRANDNGFRDDFSGFQLVNVGGDYTLGRITIEGTN